MVRNVDRLEVRQLLVSWLNAPQSFSVACDTVYFGKKIRLEVEAAPDRVMFVTSKNPYRATSFTRLLNSKNFVRKFVVEENTPGHSGLELRRFQVQGYIDKFMCVEKETSHGKKFDIEAVC